MKLFTTIILTISVCFVSLIGAMQSNKNPDFLPYAKNSPLSLIRPQLQPADDQFWQLLFKACRPDTSDTAMKITFQCLSSLAQKGANLNGSYAVAFDKQNAQQLGIEGATYTPLVFAVASKKTELINKLLDLGADVNGMSTMGSPFQAALTTGNIQILPTLLARGADINLKDEWGQTALFGVLYHKEHKLFNFMYSHPDLDCTVQDNHGQTPLHFEILQTNPNVEIVKKLLARGANPSIKDRLGRSPLDYAREGNYQTIIALLEGREPEANTFLSDTVLSVARKKTALKSKIKKSDKKSTKAKPLSPKKRTESEVQIEQLSPTKKIREALDAVHLDAQEPLARRALAFSDDTFSYEAVDSESINTQNNISNITFDQLAPRVQDWYNPEFLAAQKKKTCSINEYARSVYYHQLPIDVLNYVLTYGTPEAHASNKHPEDVGTRYYVRGEMVFENQCDNPWMQGRKYQPGYYHCTKNKSGQIYHIGFDPIKDGHQSWSALFGTKKISFDGTMSGITHTFTV